MARGAPIAVLVAMIVLWARLIWLWRSGIIKTEPFFGSMAWNVAIFLPAGAILAASWTRARLLQRRHEQALSALLADEPLAGWHRQVRQLDATLARGTPRRENDLAIWKLTLEIVDAYPGLTAAQRDQVRRLWRSYESFGIYASVEDRLADEQEVDEPLTREEARRELLLHSIRDQLPDARDASVDLSDLRTRAVADGIDFASLAREVAELSDDTRRDAMFGSTREMILRYAL